MAMYHGPDIITFTGRPILDEMEPLVRKYHNLHINIDEATKEIYKKIAKAREELLLLKYDHHAERANKDN